MAKAREVEGLDAAEVSFREAAALTIATRAEEVFEHAHGVLDTSEIENVHDMRVATRRLRAAMEIFSEAFPRKRYRELLREVKKLADALGERRDRDVGIDAMTEVAKKLTPADRPGIEHLIGELREEQAAANVGLAAELERIEAIDLRDRLLALAASA